MKMPDWRIMLSEFKDHELSRGLYNRKHFDAARRLTVFLEAGSHTYLDEDTLCAWFRKKLTKCTPGSILDEFHRIKSFARFLEERKLCDCKLLFKMQKDPCLLSQLQGPRRYCSRGIAIEEQWQKILVDFEASLRGYSPFVIPHILRTTCELVELLQKNSLTVPDKDIFLEWLDRKLSKSPLKMVVLHVSHLSRFCQFLMGKRLSPSNPVQEWLNGQPGVYEALKLRREGKPPKYPPARLQSILAPEIMSFVKHKKSLGRKYGDVLILEHFDSYLRAHGVKTLSEVNEVLLLNFLSTFLHCKASTRNNYLGKMRQFFHFLKRHGVISSQQNLARTLAQTVSHPHVPYIFTIKEIAAILSYLRENYRCYNDFDRRTLFTLFFLIYACGLRISEAVRLKIKDVNLQELTLFVGKTKFRKSRLIPFGKRAGEYLTAYHMRRTELLGKVAESDPFFVRSIGKPYSPGSLDIVFKEVCRRTGVGAHSGSEPRVHDLRHSHAVHRLYRWYQEGADPQERLVLLSVYMGHVKTEYTQHYLHISEELMRIAGSPLERTLDEWLKEWQVLQPDE